jgi:hypothetical protein
MEAFRTAARLRIFDVDAMLASAPRRLLDEWTAFWELEPEGFSVEDRRHAHTMLAACHGQTEPERWRHRPPADLRAVKRAVEAAGDGRTPRQIFESIFIGPVRRRTPAGKREPKP